MQISVFLALFLEDWLEVGPTSLSNRDWLDRIYLDRFVDCWKLEYSSQNLCSILFDRRQGEEE